jgi:uncharacterized protein (UPF0548 family)
VSPGRLLDRVDAGAVLRGLRRAQVNFDADEVDPAGWHIDTCRSALPAEAPGPPERDGPWETACRLLEAYEFSDPDLIRAVYAEGEPLLGRDMLLEGRFWMLRFSMGVRVTAVVDEERPPDERVWGWAYETLEGHIERGRMSYEVVKHQDTGEVELVIVAHSQGAPTLGPFTTLGWKLFGRRRQLRFYRECGVRLAAGVRERRGDPAPVPARSTEDGLVLAPSTARRHWSDRLAVRRHQPS